MIVLARANTREMMNDVLAFLETRFDRTELSSVYVFQDGERRFCLCHDMPRLINTVLVQTAQIATEAFKWKEKTKATS